jgi:hypothetical protein
MSNLYLPIDNVKKLFNKWDYTEKALDLDSRPGMIARTLDQFHRFAQKERSANVPIEPYKFYVTGLFDGRKDRVDFTFNIYYNSKEDTFRVRGVKAEMGELKKIYIFGNENTWVSPAKVFKDLEMSRMSKVLERMPQIKKIPSHKYQRHL